MRLALFLSILLSTCYAANWAVLVAGSNGYWNYRHQADVCHAYHLLLEHGVPAENIILLSYDDVANDPQNPFRGQLFNKPGDNVKDVNAGCIKDYTGEDVTPQNFLDVLTGNDSALAGVGSGRVLRSGPEDHVFINFVDHGARGYVVFPSGMLFANQLISALKTMHEKQMYKKLVFYMEACESGSMFEGLLDPSLNAYAVTAANAQESSYAAYCPPEDVVNGVQLNTCLGDLFSINWMEDSDKLDPSETLVQQFNLLKQKTTMSEVCKFGDLSFDNDPVDAFIGSLTSGGKSVENLLKLSNWGSRDVKLRYLFNLYKQDQTWENAQAFIDEVIERERLKDIFLRISKELSPFNGSHLLSGKHSPKDFDCLSNSLSIFESACGKLNDFGQGLASLFVNACETKIDTWKIENAIYNVCGTETFTSRSIELKNALREKLALF